MFVVPRPRMLVERVQFALWEQSAVGRQMIAEAEPEQINKHTIYHQNQQHFSGALVVFSLDNLRQWQHLPGSDIVRQMTFVSAWWAEQLNWAQ